MVTVRDPFAESASQNYPYTRTGRLPLMSRSQVLIAFSAALDLAEGRPIGHAMRVAHIALALADVLNVDLAVRRTAFYASLLHDLGMTAATESVYPSVSDERFHGHHQRIGAEHAEATPEIERALRHHAEAGAATARALGLDASVAEAILHHHEWWNGEGFPAGKRGQDIPFSARLVTFAEAAERSIADELNPLTARYRVLERIAGMADRALDPVIARHFVVVCHDDRFWIEITNPQLPAIVAAKGPSDTVRFGERRILDFAERFAQDVVDAKNPFDRGHSVRVGALAERLAHAIGMPQGRARHVRIAGVLHDIGHMGVPGRVMAKPNILSVEEMDQMRAHPWHTYDILSQLPGMKEIALWATSHHERVDGRGYPNMLPGPEVPVAGRMIAIADSFDALTSDRPYRAAMSAAAALEVMDNAAGTQYDQNLYQVFRGIVG